MVLFLHTITTFPTIIYTFLMCVAVLFWCIAAFGMLDIDSLDIDMDMDFNADADVSVDGTEHVDGGWFAGFIMKLGLDGVPFTIILTVLFFFGWTLCYFLQLLVLEHLPLGVFRVPVGVLIALFIVFPAAFLTGWCCKPLRVFFKKLEEEHHASSASSIVGQVAVVRSGSVTTTFGEALYDDKGAGFIIRIRADESVGFKKGDRVVMIDYSDADSSYTVVSEDEFTGL